MKGLAGKDISELRLMPTKFLKLNWVYRKKIIKVGHIDDKRNFKHVDDIVDAYFIAMDKAEPGKLYIVGSEDEKNVATFREVLDTLIMMSGISGIEVTQVPEFTRPTNVPYLIGDTSEFRNVTGWTPKRDLQEILKSIQNYWDQRVKDHPNL